MKTAILCAVALVALLLAGCNHRAMSHNFTRIPAPHRG